MFGKSEDQITLIEGTRAIAAFEHTIISSNSPFDRPRAPTEVERACSIISTTGVLDGICSKCLKDNT